MMSYILIKKETKKPNHYQPAPKPDQTINITHNIIEKLSSHTWIPKGKHEHKHHILERKNKFN